MTDLPDTTGRDLARQAACLLAHARHVLVLTGAGISAESGIPTFREAQTGLWAQFSPQDLATPEAFTAHPERVWAWYRWRRQLIARGGINAGHRAIAALSHRLALTIATQNVDGLHTAAGSPDVAELHGNIWREQCTACTAAQIIAVADNSDDSPGRCQACGAMTRPAVVWFGEMLPAEALNAARSSLDKADCVLVVGTSNRVYPAAALVEAAVASSASVIEINPQPTAVSAVVDCHIAATASSALPEILRQLDAVTGNR